MIEQIRKSFIDLLDFSTWMDTTSKDKAIEKVNIKKSNIRKKNNRIVGYGYRQTHWIS
jgi:hypothetical protein